MPFQPLKYSRFAGKPLGVVGEWAYGPTGEVTPAVEADEKRRQDEIVNQRRAEDVVAYEDLMRRAPDTAVNQQGRVMGVQAVTPPVTIVTFTVPNAYVMRVTGVGVSFNDPAMLALNSTLRLPWRLEVNDIPPPGVGEAGAPFDITPGDIFRLTELLECWVPGGQRVAVVIRPFTTSIEVNVAARIVGELYKAVGLKLGKAV